MIRRSHPRLILASSSPRRQELLKRLRVPFEIREPQGVDEAAVTGSAEHISRTLAAQKAEAVLAEVLRREPGDGPGWLVLGADTVATTEGGAAQRVLGKPRDLEDARQMLLELSGRSHRVVTGVAVAREGETTRTAISITEVRFRALSAGDIQQYLLGGEYVGKAAAYGIQGKGSSLVAGICGCYYNVVGLPLRLTASLIGESIPHNFDQCDCGSHTLQEEGAADCLEAGRTG